MNRGVWMLAAWLVVKHGAEAPLHVHSRIMDMRRALADEDQIALWLLIDDAVHELVRPAAPANDWVH